MKKKIGRIKVLHSIHEFLNAGVCVWGGGGALSKQWQACCFLDLAVAFSPDSSTLREDTLWTSRATVNLVSTIVDCGS